MKNVLLCLFLLMAFSMSVQAEECCEKLIHISEERPEMIFHRSLKIDRCLSNIKYHLMYSEISEDVIDDMIRDVDYILYQLGIHCLPNTM